MKVWEIQAEIGDDLIADAEKIVEDLQNAEDCGTAEDLVANLGEALASAEKLVATLKGYVKTAKKAKE